YFCYFDRDGKAHKAFMMPQGTLPKDRDKVYSYNIPEFSIEPIRQSVKEISRMVEQNAVQAEYAERH
ncbi:MAG: hypothetical protein KBT00_06090, partial [Bacteroidales bacterium]|nr:hypothetical protein [Candidatus Cacconaster merdequi]